VASTAMRSRPLLRAEVRRSSNSFLAMAQTPISNLTANGSTEGVRHWMSNNYSNHSAPPALSPSASSYVFDFRKLGTVHEVAALFMKKFLISIRLQS
jgi:hypothetical protein